MTTPPDSQSPSSRLADHFLSLTEVLASLPGVRPRLARHLLQEGIVQMAHEEVDTLAIGTETLSSTDINEIFLRNSADQVVVSPKGVSTLIRLFMAGSLPISTAAPAEVPQGLRDYERSFAKLFAMAQARATAEAEDQAKLADPIGYTGPLDYALLEAFFWRHVGPGGGVLSIGGRHVRKTVIGSNSNSGKSRDYAVRYEFSDLDGQPVEFVKPSAYETNRRNDPDRNWGLPA